MYTHLLMFLLFKYFFFIVNYQVLKNNLYIFLEILITRQEQLPFTGVCLNFAKSKQSEIIPAAKEGRCVVMGLFFAGWGPRRAAYSRAGFSAIECTISAALSHSGSFCQWAISTQMYRIHHNTVQKLLGNTARRWQQGSYSRER